MTTTIEQRRRALKIANQVRLERSQLKRDLKLGRIQPRQVLTNPPACALGATVYEMLLAIPGVWHNRASKLLSRASATSRQISPRRTLRELTERQRHALATELEALEPRWNGTRTASAGGNGA